MKKKTKQGSDYAGFKISCYKQNLCHKNSYTKGHEKNHRAAAVNIIQDFLFKRIEMTEILILPRMLQPMPL